MTYSIQKYMIGALIGLCSVIHCAHAGMISTHQIDALENANSDRQLIYATLQRNDVRRALLDNGVNPAHVEQRIDQLTDDEVQQLAYRFNELPTAGGAGLILFASGPIVLMLELMGLTDLTTTF